MCWKLGCTIASCAVSKGAYHKNAELVQLGQLKLHVLDPPNIYISNLAFEKLVKQASHNLDCIELESQMVASFRPLEVLTQKRKDAI